MTTIAEQKRQPYALSPPSDSLTAAPVALMAAGIKPDMTALKAQLLSEKARCNLSFLPKDRIKKKITVGGCFYFIVIGFCICLSKLPNNGQEKFSLCLSQNSSLV